MNETVYGVIAYIMRYFFALLCFLAVYAALSAMRREAVGRKRALAGLPDAGLIGEWAVIGEDGSVEALIGAPPDGMIGGGRMCDVRVAGMPVLTARFSLRPDGLHMVPLAPGKVFVDGQPVRKKAVLRHGATLSAGGQTVQLRLFAGVLLKGEAPVQEETEAAL